MPDLPPPTENTVNFLKNKVMGTAAAAVHSFAANKPVSLVYHNDADGISSAVIVSTALKRIGREIKFYCTEQIYNVPLRRLYKIAEGPIIFMDLGIGKRNEAFIRDNTDKRPTIIIDHHGSENKPKMLLGQDRVYDINCTKYQIDGDRHSSASTLTYMFASRLTDIHDIAHLAVLGAVGDKNHTKGEEKGKFHTSSLDHRVAEISHNAKEEEGIYKIKLTDDSEFLFAEQLAQEVNLLGSIGFRKRGSELGVAGIDEGITGYDLAKQLLIKGYDDKIIAVIENLEEIKNAAYEDIINRLREEDYKKYEGIFYFDAKDAFKGMGVKTIGNFCNYLLSQRKKKDLDFLGFNNYIMGAQLIEPVPWEKGVIDPFDVQDVLKISIRTPIELQDRINANMNAEVTALLEAVNPNQVGSSHRLRGATIITKNKSGDFLSFCQAYINEGRPVALELPELDI